MGYELVTLPQGFEFIRAPLDIPDTNRLKMVSKAPLLVRPLADKTASKCYIKYHSGCFGKFVRVSRHFRASRQSNTTDSKSVGSPSLGSFHYSHKENRVT